MKKIFLLIFLSVFSVKVKPQNYKIYSKLYILDTLVFETGNSHPHKFFVHFPVFVNKNYYLKITDRKNKNLLLFNLESKAIDTVFINKHWNYAEKFESLEYVFIKSLDSIYISGPLNELYLINKEGKLLQKWKYNYKNKFGDLYSLKFYGKNFIFLNDSVFYITHSLFLNSDNFNNRKKIFNQLNIIEAKLRQDKIILLNNFGSFYKNAIEYYHPNLSFKPDFVFNSIDSIVLLYFNKHDTVYAYKNGRYLKCADISSRYKTEYKKYDYEKDKTDPLNFDKYLIEEPGIIDIQFDYYRNLYYIFYKHRQGYRENNGNINTFIDADFSIIILDKELKKINEIVFKNKFSYSFEIFALPEGLAIGINHEFQPHIKENKLKFIILDIDKYVH